MVTTVIIGGKKMQDNNETKIDLTKYFDYFYRTLMKMKVLFLVIIIIMVAIFEIKTLFFFKTAYSSNAVFVVYKQDQDNIFATNDENDDMFVTFSNLLTGEMMQSIIRDGLGIDPSTLQINLTKVPDTNLVSLQVTSDDGETSYHVANCILNNYSQVTDLVMSDVQISLLDTPVVPANPDSYPDYLKNGVIGFGLGIVICFMIILIKMIFKHTIISSEDVKETLHLNNITKIPYLNVKRKRKSKQLELLLSNPRIQYSFRQAFHDLRLRFEQVNKKNNAQVFMIGSVLPNEGKSMVATNVAIALADKGHQVALVDLDLRNPSIYKMLDQKQVSGSITGYLKGELSSKEIINQYQDYSLDIIYGVESYDEAPELLSKPALKQLLETLKKEYEYIILDVPPLYILEDALIISDHCDTGLIVIKQDYASQGEILDSLEELNEHLPYIMATVINQARSSIFNSEGHRYGYGYGGYGYGYK